MIFALGFLSLFSAPTTRSNALSCTVCRSESPTTCFGDRTVCPSGLVCGSTYSETITGEKTSMMFRTGCVIQEGCDFKGNRDLNGTKLRLAFTCCSTDGCMPPVPTLLPSSSEPNGVTCPPCEAQGSTLCDSSETLKCTGNENICFLVETLKTTGLITSSSIVWGCATQSYCGHDSMSHDYRGTTKINYLCSSGFIRVQKVVLTPAVVCLLLLKWLF